jgi:hypothetical protein
LAEARKAEIEARHELQSVLLKECCAEEIISLKEFLAEARKAVAISETRESKWMAMVDVLQRAFDSASDKLAEAQKNTWQEITPENLPKVGGCYLVTLLRPIFPKPMVQMAHFFIFEDGGKWSLDGNWPDKRAIGIIAWMKFPTPFNPPTPERKQPKATIIKECRNCRFVNKDKLVVCGADECVGCCESTPPEYEHWQPVQEPKP